MNRSTFRTRRFAGLEKLESREMFAGVLDYNSSTKVLTVRGEGFNDQATIRYEGSRVTVDLFTQRSNGSVDHKDRTLDISRVVRIQFEGLNGNDRMSVSQGAINPGVNLAATSLVFSGGNGDDTFVNNSGVRSTANGGAGNDSLSGGLAVDTMFGDAGNDQLQGSLGNDYLRGGDGNDVVIGDAGNDTLRRGYAVWWRRE